VLTCLFSGHSVPSIHSLVLASGGTAPLGQQRERCNDRPHGPAHDVLYVLG
jgi:hypothetical protein